ncbi:MAG: hypothetical protein LC623_00410 [Halobacteriales archaeon]|nr:hypothetical protein [Halobacteriales archaeon]
MAADPKAKVDVNRPNDAADRLAMLKELAKMTKPTGASSQGKSEERPDDE